MQDFSLLCDGIYDAAIDAERWPRVLEALASMAHCSWAALLTRRCDAWIGWRISSGDAPAAVQVDAYLRSDAARCSETTTRLFAVGHPGFISDLDHFTPEERRTDPYFQWATAHGFDHGAATGFQLNSGDRAVVQLMRRTGTPAFTGPEIAAIDALRPHLARAAMLAARWKMERLRATAEALELVGIPAVVLTGDCRVMAANRLAEDSDAHLLWLAHEGLGLVDECASSKLRRHVAACVAFSSTNSASSFPAWDAEHEQAIIVHIVPLSGQRRELFDGGLALVIFSPVGSAAGPDPQLLRELFDLTAAEARVATQLATGRSVEEIAGSQGVSTATVRSQTQSILGKLGVHRQAEIAAQLGSRRNF